MCSTVYKIQYPTSFEKYRNIDLFMSITYVYYIISIPVAGLIQGGGTLQGMLLPFLYGKGTLEDTHVFSPFTYALYS